MSEEATLACGGRLRGSHPGQTATIFGRPVPLDSHVLVESHAAKEMVVAANSLEFRGKTRETLANFLVFLADNLQP
jgi:hypothetical protein